MAASVLTIAGQFFGGPLGAMVGSVVGNLLFPQELADVHGPRLSDLKVTVSTYGQMIPIVWGRARIAGNVIFSTERIEHQSKETVGGKGGPTQDVYSYSYTQSFAISICEGEIVGIRKIYANGKCIFNISDDATASTTINSTEIAKNIRVYTGSSEQMPDPLIQSLAGIENTSAYRGTAYIVFDNFNLGEYGNSLPNLEFEIIKVGQKALNSESLNYFGKYTNAANFKQSYAYQIYNNTNVRIYNVIRDTEAVLTTTLNSDNTPLITKSFLGVSDYAYKSDDNSALIHNVSSSGDLYPIFFTVKPNGSVTDLTNLVYTDTFNYGYDYINYNKKNNNIVIYFTSKISGSLGYLFKINLTNGATIRDIPTMYGRVYDMDQTDDYIYTLEMNKYIVQYDLNLNYIETVYTHPSSNLQGLHVSNDAEIYTVGNSFPSYLSSICVEISSGTPKFIAYLNSSYTTEKLFYDGANFYYANNHVNGGRSIHKFGISTENINLSDVLKDICNRGGLDDSKINISLIDKKMHGYVLAKRSTLRSAIEPLQQSYFFDAVDSDGKIKFVPRGGQIAAIIPAEELAVHTFGSEPVDNVTVERKQDVDLPVEVVVSYYDLNGAYQVSTQYSRRQNTEAVNVVSLELPICTTGDYAKTVSQVLLSEGWQGRRSVKFTLPIKYLYLEPTDVVQIYKGLDIYIVRISEIEEQNGILNITAITEDITRYDQEYVGATLAARNEEVLKAPPTNLQFLDIPLLRDIDDKKGCYVAAGGYGIGFNGASLMTSIDGGVTYQTISTLNTEAIIGNTTSILGNFLGGNIIDELSSVTVNSRKELFSTDITSLLNNSNIALLGDEIIQFKTATLTGVNTYKLSGFIRGKFGSEWAINTHTTNDRFIILNTSSIGIIGLSSSEYDLERLYKAVSNGSYIEDAIDKTFAFKGISQECYSPVHLGGGRDASGNITLKWVRRSRVNNTWNNKVDVPLGEDTEAYEIDILSGTTIKRTLTSSTNTVQYTSAMQIADFGSNKTLLDFKVYQMSTLRGRGFAGTGKV